jgi:hypothetical protein
MSIDRLRTLIEGADEKTLSLYKQNLAKQWDRFTPEQQRDAFEKLGQFPQFSDFERFQKPEVKEPSTLQKIGRFVSPWKEEQGETFRGWIGNFGQASPIYSQEKLADIYKTEQAKDSSFWSRAFTAPTVAKEGDKYYYIQQNKVPDVVSTGIVSIASPAKLLGTAPKVAQEVPKALEQLTEILKGAKKARQLIKPVRKAELGEKFAKAEEAWDAEAGIEGWKAALGKMRGGLTTPKFELDVTKGFKNIVNDIFTIIRGMKQVPFGDRLTLGKAMSKIMVKEVPQPAEIKLIEKYLSPALAGTLDDILKTSGQKAFEKVIDVLGIPRAVLSSVDLSGLLRQGVILATRHPLDVLKSVKPMLKSLLSDANTITVDAIRKARPNYMLGVQHGLYMSPVEFAKVGLKEEAFASNFVHKIPLVGKIVKASERSYVTVLNEIRSRVWETVVGSWQKLGMKTTGNDLDELAKFINYASGRGSIPQQLQGASNLLNATLFSPRLLMSRIQLPTMLFSKSPLVRKEAIKTLATFMGTGVTLLGLADLAGASVGWLDPRSSDYGKIKIGNTRMDIWSGYLQYIRFLSQLTTGQRKDAYGNLVEINRKEVVDRFAQSKASPAFGFLIDLLKGETYMGEEMSLDTKDVLEQFKNRLVPLFVQDMFDAVSQEGFTGGLIALPGILGVGVTTYVNKPDRIRREIAQSQGFNTWEELGKTLGQNEQMKIEKTYPELKNAIEEQKQKETSSDYISSQWKDVGEGIEETFRLELDNASREFRETGNGQKFRERIRLATYARRAGYASRSSEGRFEDLVSRYEKPLTEAQKKKLNSNDLALRDYYNKMYADSMYDEYGNYDFNRADLIRNTFSPEQLAYIEENLGIKQEDYPEEVKLLKQIQKFLQPYWDIETQVWASLPKELKDINDQLVILGQTNPAREKQILRGYPQILWARRTILKTRKQMREQNPELAYYISLFY